MKKSANADEVYNAVVKKIGMSKKVSSYFYIFEIVEYNFGNVFSCKCMYLSETMFFF